MSGLTFREAATNAIRYWERMRLVYNGVLLLIVVISFFALYPGSRQNLSVHLGLFLFLLAVLANAAYSVAYIVEVFAQMTGYQTLWLKLRWVLFSIGVLFAGIITYFWTIGLFSSREN
jgi:hypothetical protein